MRESQQIRTSEGAMSGAQNLTATAMQRPTGHEDDLKTPPWGEVSGLLRAWSDGDQRALEKLTPIVYDELHRLARRYMQRERPGHSLQEPETRRWRAAVSLEEVAVVGGDEEADLATLDEALKVSLSP